MIGAKYISNLAELAQAAYIDFEAIPFDGWSEDGLARQLANANKTGEVPAWPEARREAFIDHQWLADRSALLDVVLQRKRSNIGGIVPGRQNIHCADRGAGTGVLVDARSALGLESTAAADLEQEFQACWA